MQIEYQAKAKARVQEKDERPPWPRGLEAAPAKRPPQAHRLKMAPDEKFGKHEHILKTGDFAKVYKKGRAARGELFFVHYLANGLDHSRIGFSIGSARVSRATRRNRVRRILREVYRRNKKGFKPGFDLVVVVKKDPGKVILYKDLETLFLKLTKAAGVL